MKAARRPGPPRKALSPSAEKLHTRLALVEQAQGLRARKTFVFMPPSKESKPTELPEGTGPERGDLCLVFPPLFDTAAEAQLTVEAFRERYVRTELGPVAQLPWKRDLAPVDPPQRRRDPDRELEQLAEARETPDIRPLTAAELQREAMSGLLATGNLLRRHVVRDALSGGQVPLGDDEEFPRCEFAGSDRGTLLVRIWNHRGDPAKPRAATDSDRERWPAAFERFLSQCFRTEEEKK